VNRRRFLVSAATTGLAAAGGPWIASSAAATDDELAFANFGIAGELLLGDFYAKALSLRDLEKPTRLVLRSGKASADRHAKTLGELLVGAGQTAPERDDFAFVWPKKAFASLDAARSTGLTVIRPLLGAYQTALASISEQSYRVLYASLAASLGQQAGALAGVAAVEPFPVATDLESASAALEGYLG